MDWGAELAWARTAVPACCRIWYLVMVETSAAMSASRITDSAAMKFSTAVSTLCLENSIRFCAAPMSPKTPETTLMAVSMAVRAVRESAAVARRGGADSQSRNRHVQAADGNEVLAGVVAAGADHELARLRSPVTLRPPVSWSPAT